jgi:hypothetical protein
MHEAEGRSHEQSPPYELGKTVTGDRLRKHAEGEAASRIRILAIVLADVPRSRRVFRDREDLLRNEREEP